MAHPPAHHWALLQRLQQRADADAPFAALVALFEGLMRPLPPLPATPAPTLLDALMLAEYRATRVDVTAYVQDAWPETDEA